ncbi:MAG TPA: nuclease [Anaeromyxobacter sp.]|nr:nuclease [Anaeromyxobacter sp.]
MRRLALALLLAAAGPAAARGKSPSGAGVVILDGVRTPVRWNDGDSFRIEAGPRKGERTRLEGVNALETFGPAHRWGGWRPEELLAIAKAAGPRAASEPWRCTTAGARDAHRRLLVSCPELALALVREGLAMVFAVDAPADPALVAAQRAAQGVQAGMWAKGVPPRIVSSAHSADEADLDRRGAYDRVVDTWTGAAVPRRHVHVYRACEWVCAGEGERQSCFLYVPYERRYRHKPWCLRGERP